MAALLNGFDTPKIDVFDPAYQVDPAHAPDKVDMWKLVPVEQDGWVLAHNAVRHELAELRKAMTAVGIDTKLAPWQCDAIKKYVAGHLIHVHEHHRNEDDIFNPFLRQRILYPDKLEADHVELVEKMDEIEQVAGALVANDTLGTLMPLWSRYEALMLPHLHEEEVVGLPLARAYFSPAEIGKVVESFMKNGDPVSMGGFIHVLGGKKDALTFMANHGIPGFVWHIPGKGFKALRILYRKKMQSHIDSLIAGRVVSTVHVPKATKAARNAPADENAVAQVSSPVKRVDVQVLAAR